MKLCEDINFIILQYFTDNTTTPVDAHKINKNQEI